jgi:hypothetical protein
MVLRSHLRSRVTGVRQCVFLRRCTSGDRGWRA